MLERIQYCQKGVPGKNRQVNDLLNFLYLIILVKDENGNGKRFCIQFRIITKIEDEVNTYKTGAQQAWGNWGVGLPCPF